MRIDIMSDGELDTFEAHARKVLLRKPGLRLIDAQESLLLIGQIRFWKKRARLLQEYLTAMVDDKTEMRQTILDLRKGK